MSLPDNVKIGERYYFAYPERFVTLPAYSAHRGQLVTVLRPISPKEGGQGGGMERIFVVQAEDGWIGHAFASELLPRSKS
jgi:hypothetical protein